MVGRVDSVVWDLKLSEARLSCRKLGSSTVLNDCCALNRVHFELVHRRPFLGLQECSLCKRQFPNAVRIGGTPRVEGFANAQPINTSRVRPNFNRPSVLGCFTNESAPKAQTVGGPVGRRREWWEEACSPVTQGQGSTRPAIRE
ncbi:hypothetical protein J6590_031449 [Homalodisca vitripennis]|nr:hypothetical protein J6590_031449 [Homalodisca vitripennis]